MMSLPQTEIRNRKSAISLVAAMSDNRVIGRSNALPWHLPADLKHFKSLTTGHAVVMGRKTFESVGRPLPNRRNIVVTRQKGWRADGVEVFHDVPSAIASGGEGTFIVGGEQIYRAALPLAGRIYLTRVHGTFGGDAFFPAFEGEGWELIEEVEHPADERHEYSMTFETWERR